MLGVEEETEDGPALLGAESRSHSLVARISDGEVISASVKNVELERFKEESPLSRRLEMKSDFISTMTEK